MHENPNFDPMGMTVTYQGDNRIELDGKEGTVTSIRRAGNGAITAYGVRIRGIADLVWAAPWAWGYIVTDNDIDKAFTDAVGGPLAVAKAEITRLKARLAELEAAVKVIESL
jgi:hypothetical protein